MTYSRILSKKLYEYVQNSKNILLLGPRQVGKSTLIEETLKNAFSLIEPNFSISIVKDNLSDNKILACAVAAKANYLISGDKKHILLLKKIKNIPILSPEQFLKLIVWNYLLPE